MANKPPDISNDLLAFLLDAEIVESNASVDSETHFLEKINIIADKLQIQLGLRFRKSGNALYNAYDEIGLILKSYDHPVNHDVVMGVVLMFCLCPLKKRSEAIIQQYFSMIRKVKLKQYLFFHGHQQEKIVELKFHDFTVGHIDYAKFESFMKGHSGSDFSSLQRKQLENSAGVVIKPQDVNIIDFYKWLDFLGLAIVNMPKVNQEFVNHYLMGVSREQYLVFKNKFYKQQQFINSMFGLTYTLTEFERNGISFVNIFYGLLSLKSGGWVLPFEHSLNAIRFPDPRIIKRVNTFLENNEFIN